MLLDNMYKLNLVIILDIFQLASFVWLMDSDGNKLKNEINQWFFNYIIINIIYNIYSMRLQKSSISLHNQRSSVLA